MKTYISIETTPLDSYRERGKCDSSAHRIESVLGIVVLVQYAIRHLLLYGCSFSSKPKSAVIFAEDYELQPKKRKTIGSLFLAKAFSKYF